MNNRDLYLIGTMHVDIDGDIRLRTLLDKLSPNIVALEFHKDLEKFTMLGMDMDENERKVGEFLGESGLDITREQRRFIAGYIRDLVSPLNFEFRASKEHACANNGVRLDYIDIFPLAHLTPDQFSNLFFVTMRPAIQSVARLLVQNDGRGNFIREMLSGDKLSELLRQEARSAYRDIESTTNYYDLRMDPNSVESLKAMQFPGVIDSHTFNPHRDKIMAQKIRELYDGKNRVVSVCGAIHLRGISRELSDLQPTVITLDKYDSF